MTLKYDITDAEFAEFSKTVYQKNWSFSSIGWKFIIFLVALVGINMYTSMSKTDDEGNGSGYVAQLITWLILIVILAGAWFLLTKIVAKNSASNAQSTSKMWIYALAGVGSIIGYWYFSSSPAAQNVEGSGRSIVNSLLSWFFMLGIIGSIWLLILSRLTSAKRLKPEDRETILGEREMVFYDDKFTTKNQNTESVFRWEAIKKWEQTTHLYLLFTTDNSAFIVPKRVFENDVQQAEFEQLIKGKLPNLTSQKYLDA